MKEEELTVYDLIDFALDWWLLYAMAVVVALVAGALLFNTQSTSAQVSTAVTIYPAVPGIATATISTELSERMQGSIPGLEATGNGFTVAVSPDRTEVTANLMAATIDKYEADLRARLMAVRDAAEAEYHKHPENEAAYNNFYQFQMFPDDTKLVSHTESIRVHTPSLRKFLIGSAAIGLIVGVFLSVVVFLFKQWSRRRLHLHS